MADTAAAPALLLAALGVSLPTFGWVLAGILLARVGWLSPERNERISRLAFNFGLPLMLFAGAATVDYQQLGASAYLLAGLVATLLVCATSWAYSHWRGHPFDRRGIFVQGAFRSNLAIMGLALSIAAYGERGAQLAALAVAVITTLYNVLAVAVLNATLGARRSLGGTLIGILRNPLLIGIGAGAALSLSGLPQPGFVAPLGRWLSAFFLPVMLVCVGAAISLRQLRSAGALAWEATAWRLLIAPLLTVALALALGVRGEALGVLFLLVATPAAASGYVMVVTARGDGPLAASIIVLTTVLSVITITLGFFLLTLLGLA